MAGLINLKLLTDFFNKIGQKRRIRDVSTMSGSCNSGHHRCNSSSSPYTSVTPGRSELVFAYSSPQLGLLATCAQGGSGPPLPFWP